MKILIRSACNEIKTTRNNPNQNYFLIYEIWDQCREYIPRHEFEKALADLARSGTAQLLGGDPSILTGQQIKDCYKDHKNRLRINLKWVKNPANKNVPEQVKTRLAYLEMENQRLQDEITRLKSGFHQQQESESADPPKNFQGWTVSKNRHIK